MKKILALTLALLMCSGLLCSCVKTQAANEDDIRSIPSDVHGGYGRHF